MAAFLCWSSMKSARAGKEPDSVADMATDALGVVGSSRCVDSFLLRGKEERAPEGFSKAEAAADPGLPGVVLLAGLAGGLIV